MIPNHIGRYEIRSEIGRGGMATVYLAYDPSFKRNVAIKVLPPQYLDNQQLRARFEREAQTIATIEHPAIVPVYDFGGQEGQLYLVMRHMRGGSLATRLQQGGAMPLDQAARIITRLAPALDAVHARGIIHRDLKPANILFDDYGNAFLSDFGIVHLEEATTALTGDAIIGTPAYMSPEQVRGEAHLDGRSDIYAFGIILFEMLTGRAPYSATTPVALAMKHVTEPVPRILPLRPDLPPGLDDIVSRVLAKEREQRFSRAGEFAVALMKVVKSSPAYPVEKTVGEETWLPYEGPTLAGRPSAENQPDFESPPPLEIPQETVPPAGQVRAADHALSGAPETKRQTDWQAALDAHQEAERQTALDQATEPDGVVETAPQPAPQAIDAQQAEKPLQEEQALPVEELETGARVEASLPQPARVPDAAQVGREAGRPPGASPARPAARPRTPFFLAGGLVGLLALCGLLVALFIGGRMILSAMGSQATPTEPASAANLQATATLETASQPEPVQETGSFQDDFSDPASGWPIGEDDGGAYGYERGSFQIYVKQPQYMYWVTPDRLYSDVSIEVDATKVAGADDNYFGVLCRIQDEQNFYYLVISSNGYYAIGKYKDGQFLSLLESAWLYSEIIHQGDTTNNIQADCVGSRLALYANGTRLGQAEDSDFSSGDAGLIAATIDTPGTRILFDNYLAAQR